MKRSLTLFGKLMMGVALLAATVGMAAGEARATYVGDYQTINPSSWQTKPYFSVSSGTDADFAYTDSTSNIFTISGLSGSIASYTGSSGAPTNFTGPNAADFQINITVAHGGTSWSSGNGASDLIIEQGSGHTKLLTGTLTDFGLLDNTGGGQANADVFRFIFQVTGGSYASNFGGVGAKVGLQFNAYEDLSGDVNNWFSTGLSSTAMKLDGSGELQPMATETPLPASIYMFLSGFMGLGLLRKLRMV